MTEIHHLLIDTKNVSNKVISATGDEIVYDVELSGKDGFDYGDIRWVTEATLRWVRFENWSSGTMPYLTIYIEELGDHVIGNNSFHNRSSFVVPLNTKDLIYMTDAMANKIVYTEPIQSLSKLRVRVRADGDLRDAGSLHEHTMLLSLECQRRQLY